MDKALIEYLKIVFEDHDDAEEKPVEKASTPSLVPPKIYQTGNKGTCPRCHNSGCSQCSKCSRCNGAGCNGCGRGRVW